ncbi:MAG: FKBP-type peptidyl-prolyl cis-trans isomerase [Gammaproteobacteria bacterium]|nr:FKBP-type peptidyl-prolyl cis-trans isomerase [Gammaproteobacteria bacterium]
MKKTILAAALLAAASTHSHSQDVALDTDNDKLSYSLGLMIGERVLKNYGDTLNYDLILQAMKAQHTGAETAMTLDGAQQTLQEQQQKAQAARAEEAKQMGQKFLDDNAAREGVTVTDSGLQYEVLSEGDGPKPALEDTVSVHYVGTLTDGRTFDSSIDRGEPAAFPLQSVIPGWTEGLQLMPVGSKYRFVIPSDLAYGERGAGQSIGPGETLIFEVELLEIKAN